MSKVRHWLIMVVLSFSGGIIFLLPFLFEVYYRSVADALGLTNTEMGILFSAYGVTSLIVYFPGGWLADRISPRKLMTSSLLTTGLGGLWFATLPTYEIVVAIHIFWGVSITLLFWGAMIRVTRNWAPPDQQGKAFGVLETLRGIGEASTHSVLLFVFAWLGSTEQALTVVITQLSLVIIALGVLSWFVIEDVSRDGASNNEMASVTLRDIIAVLKMPVIWLIAIVVLCAYCAYWGSFTTTPYSSDIFMTTVAVAGVISVGRMWLKPIAALIAGFVADAFGIAVSVAVLFAVLVVCFSTIGLISPEPGMLPVALINVAIVALAVFALRGIYFALLEEGGVPLAVTGTAGGIISAIGFTPDVFMPLFFGVITDSYPGADGYRYFYLVTSGFCAVGLVAATTIYFRYVRKPA
jgi:nitrate/nitrite transporter NarK